MTGPALLTDEELDDLARDVATGVVFITNTMEGYKAAFGFVLVMASDHLDLEYSDRVGAMWERIDRAGPRGINGFPFFTSANFIHEDDLQKLLDAVERKRAAMDEALKA